MLLDVNVLVALAWDSHVHHVAARRWFDEVGRRGWATCAVTEMGFVRVSSNPKVLPHAVPVTVARQVLGSLRAVGRHSFLTDDMSEVDPDAPVVHGHRQVTDAHLVALARRRSSRLVTFDRGAHTLAPEHVTLLEA